LSGGYKSNRDAPIASERMEEEDMKNNFTSVYKSSFRAPKVYGPVTDECVEAAKKKTNPRISNTAFEKSEFAANSNCLL
jgi:hypothetical protein